MLPSTASYQKLQSFARRDPALAHQLLADAGRGSDDAIDALREQTGISSKEALREAGQAYLDGSLDRLFDLSDASQRSRTTGGGQSNFAPALGGASSANVNNLMNMRAGGGAVNLVQLGGKLASIVDQREALTTTQGELQTRQSALEGELKDLNLSWRERWFGGGFVTGVLGGDKDAGKKGKDLKWDIETNQDTIEQTDGAIRSTYGQADDEVVSALSGAGDLEFKRLDGRLQETTDMKRSVGDFVNQVEDALSGVRRALWSEQQEVVRERRNATQPTSVQPTSAQKMKGPHVGPYNTVVPGASPDWMGNRYVRNAERSIAEVGDMASRLNEELSAYGGGVVSRAVTGTRTRKLGNAVDEMLDHFRGDLGRLGEMFGHVGSVSVVFNLRSVKRELEDILDSAVGLHREIGSHHKDASSARQSYIDQIEAQALAAA